LAFRDLQGYYTELGEKMQGEAVPGDVYRALKYVKNEIGNEMSTMAKQHNVGTELADAQKYWKDYEKTFHDMRSVALGGSPVARVLRRADAGNIISDLTGNASARAVTQLTNYDPVLAKRAASIASNFEQMKALPSKLKLKEAPAAPEVKTAKIPEPPVKPPRIPMPEAPDLKQSLYNARLNQLESTTGKLRHISSLYRALARPTIGGVLESPKVVEWLTKPSAGDFAALEKLPRNQRLQVAENLTRTYINQAQGGRFVPISDGVRQFLAPEQLRRIEATGSAGKLDMSTTPATAHLAGERGVENYNFSFNNKPVGNIRLADFSQFAGEGAKDIIWSGIEGGDIEPGKGFGGQMYRQVIQDLKAKGVKTLYSDANLSDSSKRVWETLRKDYPVEKEFKMGDRYKLDLSRVKAPAQAPIKPPAGASGTNRASATAIMLALKNGQITQQQADSQIQRLNGGGGRKLIPMPSKP
jgi:hypothetical protein